LNALLPHILYVLPGFLRVDFPFKVAKRLILNPLVL